MAFCVGLGKAPRGLRWLLAALALAAGSAAADTAKPAAGNEDGRRTIHRLPANLGRAVVGVFHKDNLLPVGVGGAVTGIASFWDQDVSEAARPSDWGESLETAGGPIWSSAFIATMFTAGRISHAPRFRAMTYDMLAAAFVNAGYTTLLKAAISRTRPNGQDNNSFPSGHTSNSFALAAVAERHYGWKLGVPAYLAAGLVGASRIQQDKHYLSDVLAGATLGYVVGRTVVRVNNRPLEGATPAASFQALPLIGRRARGVQIAISF